MIIVACELGAYLDCPSNSGQALLEHFGIFVL